MTAVDVHYDWDEIMVYPKLVSWDKLTWKTIQQINNWNKVLPSVSVGLEGTVHAPSQREGCQSLAKMFLAERRFPEECSGIID